MRRSNLFLAAVLALGFGLGSIVPSHATTGTDDFEAQATADFQQIADFMNGPFKDSLGFFTGLGWNGTPTIFDLTAPPLVGSPHFELGLGVGADFIRLPDTSSLNLSTIDASSNVSLPGGLPIPYPVLTARVGLFNGLDIGFRYTNLPPIAISGVNAKFDGWGLDARFKICDGVQLPTVSVGMSYDTMNGTVSVATNINQTYTYTDTINPDTYTVNLTGLTTYALNWSTKSVGAKIEIGKNLGFLYPFAAIGFQRNEGSVTSSMTGNFTETLTGGTYPGSATSTIKGLSSAAPVVLEPKYVLGIDIGTGLHWAAVGESNGTDIAGTIAFRGQF